MLYYLNSLHNAADEQYGKKEYELLVLMLVRLDFLRVVFSREGEFDPH